MQGESCANLLRLSYSKEKVKKAGRRLVAEDTSEDVYAQSLEVLNWWRLQHAGPMRSVQTRLRYLVGHLGLDRSFVVQRLKRTPSILSKLERNPKMNLNQMQDIAGCRVVVRNLRDMYAYEKALSASPLAEHFIRGRDYYASPKASGYRGIHQVFRYAPSAPGAASGHFVEVQIRTRIQHAWATAVEIMSIFLGESLKSSQGSDEWLEFFRLAGDELAYYERRPFRMMPRMRRRNFARFRELALGLEVEKRLTAYSVSVKFSDRVNPKKTEYYLMKLDPHRQTVEIRSYPKGASERATRDYLHFESDAGLDVVLVSADSVRLLKEGYQNYFADAHLFVQLIGKILKEN